MTFWPRRLSLRLAVLFALASLVLLGAIGSYLYISLKHEITWRDDQALLGRLERMQALIQDSDSIAALRSRPKLYENMLGNRESLLWLINDQDHALISINPLNLPQPQVQPSAQARLGDSHRGELTRLAWVTVQTHEGPLTLVAGRVQAEQQAMLARYRLNLWLVMTAGALLAFGLGWFISARALQPVRQLARRAAAIAPQNLHQRLDQAHSVVELDQLSHALNQMLARLEQGFNQLSRFSEDLAHEMRTPLSNLMGQTQHALRYSRSLEDYQEVLASNQEEYERLSRMIDNMLFLARSEQPQASIHREHVDARALTEQLLDYFEGVAYEKQLSLDNLVQGQCVADPALLRRALANLIANALRYADNNSTVTVSSHSHDSQWVLSVHNSGPTIAEHHIPYLFDRFYRCDTSRNQPDDSGGLGLAIVRSIMQLHHGQVSVSSNETGTTFSLLFPQPVTT